MHVDIRLCMYTYIYNMEKKETGRERERERERERKKKRERKRERKREKERERERERERVRERVRVGGLNNYLHRSRYILEVADAITILVIIEAPARCCMLSGSKDGPFLDHDLFEGSVESLTLWGCWLPVREPFGDVGPHHSSIGQICGTKLFRISC